MPILPRNCAHGREAGFSLMEILVVLAIMGLMLSVVSVRMVRTIDSAYFTRTADAAMADVLLVRADALLKGEGRILVTDKSSIQDLSDNQKSMIRRFDIPNSWTVKGNRIQISRTGTCFGGEIALEDENGRRAVYRLTPPKCKSERIDDLPINQTQDTDLFETADDELANP